MKPPTLLFRLLPFIIIGLFIAGVMSCRSRNNPSRQNGEINEISDSLRRGNIKDAVRLTNELKKKALAKKDSLTWCEAIVQQGINSYYQGQPATLLASSDSALAWLVRQKLTPSLASLLAKAYQSRGAYYDQYYFDADSTAKYLRLAVNNVVLSGRTEDLPQTYGNYANAMRLGSSLDSAAVYYHRAITVADSLNMGAAHYIPLYNGIAAVFTDMRDFDNSKIWWGKSLGIVDEMNRFDKFNTFTGVGNDLYYRKDYEGANGMFISLREMLDTVADARWERMFTDVNLADTYLRLGNIQAATPLLDTTYRYFSNEQPNPVVMSYIHTLQMREALKESDLAKASQIAKDYPVADSMRLEQLLARLEVLEELYTRTGSYDRAYEMRTRYDHLNDSLRSYTLKQRISALNALYQRDRRILNLKEGNTRQQARIFRLLAVVALTLMIIVGLVLFIVLRRGRIRKREERMMRKIMSLREENLRNRITPHFIYNALNHELSHTFSGSPTRLDSLVHLIRRQQYVVSQILIPFSEELAFVDDYIKVVSDNGRDKLNYTFSVDPDVSLDFMFPSMALQILVENVFKHGFISLTQEEERVLRISVRSVEDGRVEVVVFNRRGTVSVPASPGGTGMRVLADTIRLLNERNREKTEFKINTEAECHGLKGYSATLIIPLSLKS